MITETFIPSKPLSTPVLFLVFNRPDTTKEVFQEIRKAKPPRFYIAADGYRRNRPGEEEKVREVRDYVLANIDWDCEVKTLFREENLGCKYAVSGAISWFFEHEEQGIILEDDCLPSQSFFWFCEELLERYKDEKKVWHISGTNFQNGMNRGSSDYYFSVFVHVWGWATWREKWNNYDTELSGFRNEVFLEGINIRNETKKYWRDIFEKMKNKQVDTWDYQWVFTMWKHQGFSAIPQRNLITNMGFGSDATHTTKQSRFSNLRRYEIIDLIHPATIKQEEDADLYTSSIMFKISIPQKIKKLINCILIRKQER